MRIIFFNYEFPPLGGGAANATFYLLREYAKIPDLEVDLVTSSVDKNYHLEKIGERIRIHRLPIGKRNRNLHFQSQKELLVYSWRAYWFSRKLVRKTRYGLSHSFFTVPCGFLSLLLKWQYKLPYAVSLRGADVPGYSERFGAIYGLLTPLIKFIWRYATFVVSNSQGLKILALKSAPKQAIGVIYNGIATDEFYPIFGSPTSNIEVGLPKFNVLCVSRITERKGIKYLIDAMALLAEKYPQLRLSIIGDGDKLEELKLQITNYKLQTIASFLGRVEHENLARIYQEADVFVLPSLNEGMSNTMLEALSSGLPLIATDTGGTRELLTEGENGFIVKMKDANDIAEKIEKLILNPELAKKMGVKSREKAGGMSWERVARSYYELYNKACHCEGVSSRNDRGNFGL